MARKPKTSIFEDLIDLVARLPWWIGIALGLAAYVFLHRVATNAVGPVGQLGQPGQAGQQAVQAMWHMGAVVGQYLLPAICLLGAGLSAWRRHQRRSLVVDVAQSHASDALDGMSWRQFEMLVGEGFRLQGYLVTETGGGGADGGVDLVLTKGGEKFLVQCKQWRALKVGVEIVRELYGVMAARGATGGFVVTSGRFTEDATRFATGRNVRLIDGPQLRALIRQAHAAKGSAQPLAAIPPAADQSSSIAGMGTPLCPLCTQAMVKRMAKRGTNVGAEFWGCTGYPTCRGTRPIG